MEANTEGVTNGKAEIESTAGAIRFWIDPNAKYGDPYQWVASVRWLNKEDIEIFGYNIPVTPSIWRAIRKELQRLNVKRVLAVRYVDGKRIEKWIPIPSKYEQVYRFEF